MTDQEKENQPAWRHITENVECLAVAIIMALILKFYLIEAYKIPTGSMQPTIMGNAEQGLFDRVLVNKFIYLFREPERWDVIVFKYPLDQSKNYIKRLIGLPGEKVTIQKGDIYINDRIERKPESTIRAVLKEIYPNKGRYGAFGEFFEVPASAQLLNGDGVRVAAGVRIATRNPITSNYLDGYDPDYGIVKPDRQKIDEDQRVGDLRLTFEVVPESGAHGIELLIEEEAKRHRLYLEVAGGTEGPSRISTGQDVEERAWSDPEVVLEPGRSYEVGFSHIDDRITLHLDGDLIAVHDYEDALPAGGNRNTRVSFGPVNGDATFSEVRLYRDIYYESGRRGGRPIHDQIPLGHYFALGDNTQNSQDSRMWNSAVFSLKDGSDVKGNAEQEYWQAGFIGGNPRKSANEFVITDIYGDNVTLPFSEIEGSSYRKMPEHFIPEKLMLGKAMVIFWPVFPHFRWKLLR